MIGPAPGWTLLTPYATLLEGFWDAGVRGVTRLPNGELWVRTAVLTLRPTGLAEPEQAASEFALAKTLQALRYLTRQFALPERYSAWSVGSAPEDRPSLPEEQDARGLNLRDYFLPTAITEKHLDQLALLVPGFSPPASVLVMLDALLAAVDQDFRKALLYSAIAVESLASTTLAEAYDHVLATNDKRCRVVEIPVSGGRNARKDPIYESLGEDNFSRMLHERPLYLLGRSLSLEDPATFTKALKLYKTRNKLAHVGEVPLSAEAFEVSEEGARAGLQTATQVLNWLGDSGPYFVGVNFVRVSDGVPRSEASKLPED